jgi:hypothetical protein
MNFKTVIILFLLMFLQSCSLHYEKRFGGEEETQEDSKDKVYEVGAFR